VIGVDTFVFPLKFDNTGLRKLSEGTDEYYKQLLTMTILSEPNMLPFTPEFGIFDPTYREVDKGQFVTQASRFVPEVIITSIEAELTNDGQTLVNFSFEKR